ncbi:hypothetical protein [Thioalkalivibrio sp. ALE23]|uniref:hypothetical protein n=1 Tax=Thioalkalivibrio sp. ALE23 TaxID=1265495 RepID=UPI000365B2B0|nr:hypothetical protein [Thioalkalivibrio sp. ALE23]
MFWLDRETLYRNGFQYLGRQYGVLPIAIRIDENGSADLVHRIQGVTWFKKSVRAMWAATHVASYIVETEREIEDPLKASIRITGRVGFPA